MVPSRPGQNLKTTKLADKRLKETITPPNWTFFFMSEPKCTNGVVCDKAWPRCALMLISREERMLTQRRMTKAQSEQQLNSGEIPLAWHIVPLFDLQHTIGVSRIFYLCIHWGRYGQ